LREGAELALILRAVELSSEGLQTWIGRLWASGRPWLLVCSSLRALCAFRYNRFFAATSVILMLVAFQLALTGLHELSEARWLPASKQGNGADRSHRPQRACFFFVFIFGAAALLVLREWQSASHAKAAKEAAGEAGKDYSKHRNRRQWRWMIAAAGACLVVILC